jgi:hypothetical protein
MDRTSLEWKISDFLSTPRESDGGYAKITDDDMKDLHIIIETLINLKCEEDPDGDRPINFQLCNRREKHFLIDGWINAVPYESNMDNPLESGGKLDKLMFISERASNALRSEMTLIRWELDERRKQ